MDTNELTFMIAACEASDGHESGSLFVNTDDLVLSQKGMTEKEVWRCQHSLKLHGYIRLHANYNEEDVDPAWSRAAPEFTITPVGLRWWLMRKHGKGTYSKMVTDIKRTRDECVRNNIMSVAEWAKKLELPMLTVQKVLHAEGF